MKLITLAAASAVLWCGSTHAAVKKWTGVNGNEWSVSSNWQPSGAPQVGDVLVFTSDGPPNSFNDLVGLSVTDVLFTSANHTLGGNLLEVTKSIGGTGSQTLDLPLDLGGNSIETTGDLRFEADVSGNGSIKILGSATFVGSHSFVGALETNMSPIAPIVFEEATMPGCTTSTFHDVAGTGAIGIVELKDSSAWIVPGKPGQSIGELQIRDLAIQAGAILFDIHGATPAVTHDLVSLNGTLTLGAGSGILFSVDPGFVPSPGDSFTLIENDGTEPVVGAFGNLPQGASKMLNGVAAEIDYFGGDGNDVVLSVPPPPAPLLSDGFES